MYSYVECQKCGSRINVDTNSDLIWCACGAVGVDGNEYYSRILGEAEDWKVYRKGKEIQ